MVPALTSIRSCQRRARSLRVATLITGHCGQAVRRAAAGGEDVQVHAGGQLQRAADEVAGRRGGVDQALVLGSFSPGDSTPLIGALPDLMIEPIAFSTMFDRPPALLPGVVLALRSTLPRCR